jgi:hypothetical protein
MAPGVALIPADPKIFGAQYAADLQIRYSHLRADSFRLGRDWHQTGLQTRMLRRSRLRKQSIHQELDGAPEAFELPPQAVRRFNRALGYAPSR